MSEIKGKATNEQIAEWKKKFGEIFEIEVENEAGKAICYLKRPDRKTMKYVSSAGNDPIRGNEILLENCWLGGNETIKTDDELFFGVSQHLGGLIKVAQASIKKV